MTPKNMMIKLSSDANLTFKECYLMSDLDTIKKVWHNAFILQGVQWQLIPPVRDALWPGRDPATLFSHELFKLFTVFPFTPKIKDWNAEVKDWSVESLLPDIINKRDRIVKGRYQKWAGLNNLLLQRADAMMILLRGNLYNTPCQFCSFLFKRVSGSCPIVDTIENTTPGGQTQQVRQMCAPRILWQNEMFELPAEGTPDKLTVEDVDMNTLDQEPEWSTYPHPELQKQLGREPSFAI